jgi:integrase/recombinase XerD
MKLSAAVDDLLGYLRLAGFSPATLKIRRDQLKRFAEWLPEPMCADLRRVTAIDLDAYVAHVMAEPIGAGCRRLRVGAVKQLFKFLIDRSRLLLNPAEHLINPPRPRHLPKAVVSVAQLADLLAAPDVTTPLGLRNRALLELLYATALRVGELEALTVADVHLRDELVRVEHGKGDKPRVVPLGRQAAYWLGLYLREARPFLIRRSPNEAALFVVRTGRRMTASQVREILNTYSRARLGRRLTPHMLRHACATHLLQAGADIRIIQCLLGHERLDSTAIYTQVAAADVKSVHQRCHPKEIGRASQ